MSILLTEKHPSTADSGPGNWWAPASAAAVVAFFALIRLRLSNIPLERDEGEYAYAGQLILRGMVPYRHCYTMKLPGTAAVYALFTGIFGQTATGVHLGLLLVNAATATLLYLLGQRLFGKLAGAAAAIAFAILSMDPAILGLAAHATHFVVLPEVAGILLLLEALESKRGSLFFWSGLVLGLAPLMKQPGIFFVLFGLCYLAWAECKEGLNIRPFATRAGLFLSGAAIPFAVTCLILIFSGGFSTFWFWTFTYARKYAGIVGFTLGSAGLGGAVWEVISPTLPIWVIAGCGILVLLLERKARTQVGFILGLLVFSCASVSLGLHFREHYFILLLPVAALLCGLAVARSLDVLQPGREQFTTIPVLVFAIAVLFVVVHNRRIFFLEDSVAACREIYPGNPFPEAIDVARFLEQHSAANDRIAVLGSEPEIYFYARRLSATGYIYTYPLMERQPFAVQMQRDMQSEIEAASPRFIVYVDVPGSWLVRPGSDTDIFKWSESYIQARYHMVGVVDLFGDHSDFFWGDLQNYKQHSRYRVLVFQMT